MADSKHMPERERPPADKIVRSPNARQAFALNEAASLRRMVSSSRQYGEGLQVRDEHGALEQARRWVRVASEWRSGARSYHAMDTVRDGADLHDISKRA